MEKIKSIDTLVIHQKIEWLEILTGLETRNTYEIMDVSGQVLYIAAELKDSVLIRVLFESMRPFTICVLEPNGERVLMLNRPFRFYFHKVDILDPNRNMKYLGTIQRRFSILRRKYSVLDDKKVEIFQLSSPILDPWTFVIRMGGRDVGEITKKWSGLLEELFTTADNFGIVFPPETDLIKKSLLLGAVFLIDFVYFESGE